MNKEQAIKHLQWRLNLANHGYRITWSIADRAAISALCIEAVEHTHAPDGLPAEHHGSSLECMHPFCVAEREQFAAGNA